VKHNVQLQGFHLHWRQFPLNFADVAPPPASCSKGASECSITQARPFPLTFSVSFSTGTNLCPDSSFLGSAANDFGIVRVLELALRPLLIGRSLFTKRGCRDVPAIDSQELEQVLPRSGYPIRKSTGQSVFAAYRSVL
jgi:hypothetical protein